MTAAEPQAASFLPTRVLELELSAPLGDLSTAHPQAGLRYGHAQALIRLHTVPLGIVDLDLPAAGLKAAEVAARVWQALGARINAHLAGEGLPPVTTLTPAGLPTTSEPACLQARRAFLAEQPPFFSVIVCTRDRADMLGMALDALLALDYPRFEIVLVDNAPSNSATADLIRDQYADAPIRYVREDRPGLSWARNCGVWAARAPYIAFTDDDAQVDRHWLTEIARGFFEAENVACVTGITLPAEIESQAQEWFEQFGGHTKGRGFEGGVFNLARIKNIINPVPIYGAGVNMAFATAPLRALGGFDVALGAGTPARAGEDIIAFLKILAENHTLVYRPTAFVRHFHRRDYAGLRRQLYNYGVALTAYFLAALVYRPRYVLNLLALVPEALNYFANPSSPRTRTMKANYPRELTRDQVRGMLYGPLAYAQSLWQMRGVPREYAAPAPSNAGQMNE